MINFCSEGKVTSFRKFECPSQLSQPTHKASDDIVYFRVFHWLSTVNNAVDLLLVLTRFLASSCVLINAWVALQASCIMHAGCGRCRGCFVLLVVDISKSGR